MTSMSLHHEFTVRLAAPEDVGDLVGLMEEFYAESNYPLDGQWARASLSQLMSRPDWGCIWLAYSSGSAVRHVVLAVRYTMEHGGLSAYVDDLFVRPAFRRQGVGRGLLNALFSGPVRGGASRFMSKSGAAMVRRSVCTRPSGCCPNRMIVSCSQVRYPMRSPDPSIEPTSQRPFRALYAAAHVKR
jgi:GNAT superfamily N-acetyltransferase